MQDLSLRSYQKDAYSWAMDRLLEDNMKGVFFNLDCGLGKTVITLECIKTLQTFGATNRWLIVAPLRVAKLVWPDEVDRWSNFSDLSYSVVHGTPKKRVEALERDADIYVINYEGLTWLRTWISKSKWRADGLVLDESTYVKSWRAKRTAALKALLPDFKKRIALSATPTANCRSEIFSQMYMLDDGETLGTTIGQFRRQYMMAGGFQGKQWVMRKNMIGKLDKAVAPFCYRLDAESELDMPTLIDNRVTVELPKALEDDYNKLEKEMFLELDSGDPLLAESGGSKYSACRQFVSGAIYQTDEETEERSVIHLHDEKIDALKELNDAIPTPVLVLYWFRHSRARIEQAFPGCDVIAGGVDADELRRILGQWRLGDTKVLAAQIRAVGHGVDGLQKGKGGRDVIFFDQCDSGDLDKQVVSRVYRSGQTAGTVRVHRLICKNTVDEVVYKSVKSKLQGQDAWNQAMKEYRQLKMSS